MTCEVDTSVFSAMCDELAKICEAPPDTALREEVGKVLSRAVELTPAASKERIEASAKRATHSLQPASLYVPQRPQRRHLHQGRVLYKLSWHYPEALWSKLTEARTKDVKKRVAARGLAKQSWWKIGSLLGVSVQAPSYAQRAVATTGKAYEEDTKVRTIRDTGEIGYEIENAQPTINAIQGQRILQQAIDGRVQFFIENVKHEVFSKLTTAAKKYPGVRIE